jgi:CheY-like chemotaxis protein
MTPLDPTAGPGPSAGTAIPHPVPEPRRPLILVADDHPTNRKVIEIMLSQLADVVLVENGQLAVEAAQAQAFDLILMDMQMPVMDGVRATREIRANEIEDSRARVPVLMLTAHCLDDHVKMGREAGSDGHLVKPVSMNELHRAIRALIVMRAI